MNRHRRRYDGYFISWRINW